VVNAVSTGNVGSITPKSADALTRIAALSAYGRSLYMVLRVASFVFRFNCSVGVELADFSGGVFRASLYGSRYPGMVVHGAFGGYVKSVYAASAWKKLETSPSISLFHTSFGLYSSHLVGAL